MRIRVLGWLAAALLAGCVIPPKESPHPAALDREGAGLTGIEVSPAAEDWWVSFQDPQLDRLIRQGLQSNPTLAQAQARVEAALSQAQAAQSKRLPNVNGNVTTFYNHAPENFLVPPPLAGHSFWMGLGGASLGWDLDLFGKEAQAVHAARAMTEAANLDAQNARLLLTGAIVQTYLELNRQYALADIAARSEEQRAGIVSMTRHRVEAGLDTRLELREAEGQLPQARVAREQAQAAVGVAVHQLATLTGQGAQGYASIQRPALNVEGALPVPNELPMNLLARRPDVLAARWGIAAADARRLSDRAAFYPDVSLQALAGVASFGMSDLLKWSARGVGGGPVISLPLFDGGRLRAQYRYSESQLDSAIDSYNDTVLHAVEQAADQITQLDALAHERVDQQQTLDATESAYRLAEERYKAGLASYLTVLNAETQVLAARQGIVDILNAQADARVTLLLATGGSFDAPHPLLTRD